VLTDAVVLHQKIKPTALPTPKNIRFAVPKPKIDSLQVATDTLKPARK
jgi:hypothetical protein